MDAIWVTIWIGFGKALVVAACAGLIDWLWVRWDRALQVGNHHKAGLASAYMHLSGGVIVYLVAHDLWLAVPTALAGYYSTKLASKYE